MDLQRLTDDVELISQRYAEVFDIRRDEAWFMLKLQEEVGELTQAFLMRSGQARPKGHTPEQLQANVGAEVADVLCQLLLLARHLDVDVAAEVAEKWLVRLPASGA
ncbi:pyrophosphatase [Winogradskya humida]|uniref:Pyrophosphatase n=1 Tax=Winogradskya humida TaxID=113566 RepID=A0ABQ3ZMI7_9ACTN|nr:pyrophosphatase [Actinoplanes humidus]GIE19809.1 pyrophosphatase [Actinoplanes humidus]